MGIERMSKGDLNSKIEAKGDDELSLMLFCDATGEEPITEDDIWVNECSPT